MIYWDHIIKQALLGTGKKTLTAPAYPAPLAEAVAQTASDDTEENFLNTLALISKYRNAGTAAFTISMNEINYPEAEDQQYAAPDAHHLLSDILHAESGELLKNWLTKCVENNALILPQYLTDLTAASESKKHDALLKQAGGKRLAWLNTIFGKEETLVEEGNTWEEGTLAQRRAHLDLVAKQNITEAIELLKSTWDKETANDKTAFLDQLLNHDLKNTDSAWFENLSQTEKSKKVKDSAAEVLKKIPASSIVQQYENILKELVSLKSKGLTNFFAGSQFQFNFPVNRDKELTAIGIQINSNTKELSDDENIIFQLIASVPVESFQKYINLDPPKFIDLFNQKDYHKFMPALVLSVTKFNNINWAALLLQHSNTKYLDLLPLVNAETRKKYYRNFATEYATQIVQVCLEQQEEFDPETAAEILKSIAKQPYGFYQNYYKSMAITFPVSLLSQIDNIASDAGAVENNSLQKSIEGLKQILELKSRIQKTKFI